MRLRWLVAGYMATSILMVMICAALEFVAVPQDPSSPTSH